MLLDFKLPDVGEGVAEGEIVGWLVKEGDRVEEHQPVLEVSTDKAVVEIPAPASGRIVKILASAGQTVPVKSVVFQMEVAGAVASAQSPATAADERKDVPVTTAPVVAERLLAAPSARRVARELEVNLADVEGTGRNGVIRRNDVERHAKARRGDEGTEQPVTVAPTSEAGRTTRAPFIGIRRRIATQMSRSLSTAAHFTVVEEVDVTELVRLLPRARRQAESQGVKVTYTPYLMKALAAALVQYPSLNAMLDEAANEIVTYHYVNLGVATDTPNGLVVPVVRDAHLKGVLQLSSDLNSLAERARAGKLTAQDMQGGTFTLSNAGQVGSIHATPIINFPEVGIAGAHRIVKRPGVVEAPEGDRIEVRHYMNISMSVDHRLADGMVAVKALVYMKRLLEDPALLSL